jgi:choline dehydrogenase
MIDMGRLWCLTILSLPLFFVTTSAIANCSTYDYIVVGSGPGGGTLAANLAKAGESVLLLEAGDDQGNNPNEEIAAWFFMAYGDPTMRWDFFVERSDNVTQNLQYKHYTYETVDGGFYVGTDPPPGAKPLGVYYPRAGTLGGCSTHNALISALPSNSDWDYIAEITGDTSWA